MKRLPVAGVATLLGVLCAIQNAYGGAVMSIDLGSEWMKVHIVPNIQCVQSELVVLSFTFMSCVVK